VDKPAEKRFKRYPVGYIHIDIAEVRTSEGKLRTFLWLPFILCHPCGKVFDIFIALNLSSIHSGFQASWSRLLLETNVSMECSLRLIKLSIPDRQLGHGHCLNSFSQASCHRSRFIVISGYLNQSNLGICSKGCI